MNHIRKLFWVFLDLLFWMFFDLLSNNIADCCTKQCAFPPITRSNLDFFFFFYHFLFTFNLGEAWF